MGAFCKFWVGAKILRESQAVGFADDFLKKPAAAAPCTAVAGFVGCARRAVGEGIYLSGNEQAHRADSRKSAAKPTPLEKVMPPYRSIMRYP